MYELYFNNSLIFSEAKKDVVVEAKGYLVTWDVSTLNFSCCKKIGEIGGSVVLKKNGVIVFKGKVATEKSVMESSGVFRWDYLCVDILHQLKQTSLDKKETKTDSISGWLQWFNKEWTRLNKPLHFKLELINQTRIELQLTPTMNFFDLLLAIKEYDKNLRLHIDYHTDTVRLTYDKADTVEVTMWQDIASVSQTLDASEYKNKASAIAEWQEEIVHWKTVCEWRGNSEYRGWANDTSGQTSLLGYWAPGWEFRTVNINAHADTSSSRRISRWYKDWSGIFGVSFGGAHAPYAGHQGIDIYDPQGAVFSPPFPCTIKSYQHSYAGALGCHIEFVPLDDGNKKKDAVIRLSHMESLYDAPFVSQSIDGYVPAGTLVGIQGGSGYDSNSYYGKHLDVTIWVDGVTVDPYPYVFNMSGNGFDGWNEIYNKGREVCWQEVDWIEYVDHKLPEKTENKQEVAKYGPIEIAVRDDSLRDKSDLKQITDQSYQRYQNTGFARSIDMQFFSMPNVRCNDVIITKDVPFMQDGEKADVVAQQIDLLHPDEEKITIDNEGFKYIKLIGGEIK